MFRLSLLLREKNRENSFTTQSRVESSNKSDNSRKTIKKQRASRNSNQQLRMMEEIGPESPLRHCDHNIANVEEETRNDNSKEIFGNEENVPENSFEGETLTKLQQRVFKRVRMGGTPYKRNTSRRFSSSNDASMSRLQNTKMNDDNQQENQPLMLDTASNLSFKKQNHERNLLDDYSKHGTEIFGTTSRHSIATTDAHEKDPRFHSKRTLERAQKALEREERLSLSSPTTLNRQLLRKAEMGDPSQVFLAPVMGPPSTASPWKKISEKIAGEHPCSAVKRSSFTEDTKEAIAAAQGAPGLTATSSQESSSSSAAPSSNTSSSASSMASDLVKRLVNSKKSEVPPQPVKARLPVRQNVRGTPVRIKPRGRSQDVQATDSGYASVAKLSAWLADDPTSTKKVRHVRRGANVISKSRNFEKDLEFVIAEESNITSGAVKDKKDWLKTVFSGDCDEEPHHRNDPNRHLMLMRTRPVNDDGCARSEFCVNDDAASAISVSNKKKWLENAFKKEGQSAKSDIGPLRESRDDVTSRAKKLWQQKSEKRLLDNPPSSAQKPPRVSAAASPWSKHHSVNHQSIASRTTPRKLTNDTIGSARASTPSYLATKANTAGATSSATKEPAAPSVARAQVEEDNAPVDFRAARELLIQRSKDNGNELKVASKVQRRTDKFERITQESKRRSSAMGLLKPTWSSDSGSDAPSDSYSKTFVENIAPKRSFDELP